MQTKYKAFQVYTTQNGIYEKHSIRSNYKEAMEDAARLDDLNYSPQIKEHKDLTFSQLEDLIEDNLSESDAIPYEMKE